MGKLKSDFLVASPSLVSGAGRLLDWYGLFDQYNTSSDGQEADSKATLVDWWLVGADISDAMDQFEALR